QKQGQIAALNMLHGKRHPFRYAPFFWSQHHETTLGFVGVAPRESQRQVIGSPESQNCAVVYTFDGRITAVATIGNDRLNLQVESALEKRDFQRIDQWVDQFKANQLS